jgi:indole-3-glycerol phosphate synthase
MTFLEKMAGINRERVAAAKKTTPESALRDREFFHRQPRDAKKAFPEQDRNIIAEIKFASPSEGEIRGREDAAVIAQGYLGAGARMLSVLTEPLYFGGGLENLSKVRAAHPDALLLRKDFIVDAYQLAEARAYGADAALLIAALPGLEELLRAARELGVSALVEVHDEKELDAALARGADFIGVNNRNLHTLKVDLGTGRRLAALKPPGAVFICESGLSKAQDVRDMRAAGYDGFLMGTHFMKARDPGAALKELMEELACA